MKMTVKFGKNRKVVLNKVFKSILFFYFILPFNITTQSFGQGDTIITGLYIQRCNKKDVNYMISNPKVLPIDYEEKYYLIEINNPSQGKSKEQCMINESKYKLMSLDFTAKKSYDISPVNLLNSRILYNLFKITPFYEKDEYLYKCLFIKFRGRIVEDIFGDRYYTIDELLSLFPYMSDNIKQRLWFPFKKRKKSFYTYIIFKRYPTDSVISWLHSSSPRNLFEDLHPYNYIKSNNRFNNSNISRKIHQIKSDLQIALLLSPLCYLKNDENYLYKTVIIRLNRKKNKIISFDPYLFVSDSSLVIFGPFQ